MAENDFINKCTIKAIGANVYNYITRSISDDYGKSEELIVWLLHQYWFLFTTAQYFCGRGNTKCDVYSFSNGMIGDTKTILK